MSDYKTNARRGRTAKAVGDRHESWVEGQHEMAMHLGILAHVHHNEPKATFRDGRLEYGKRSVSDYSGVFEGGKALATEAKSCMSGDRFGRNDVTPEQQKHLEATARAGGLAFLVVEFRMPSAPFFRRFAMPWLQVPWRVMRTAQSIGILDVELQQWEVQPSTCYLSRHHTGGKRSSTFGTVNRVYPVD